MSSETESLVQAMQRVESRRALIADVDLPVEYASAALTWIAERMAEDEVLREATDQEVRLFISGARGPDALRQHYRDGLMGALTRRSGVAR